MSIVAGVDFGTLSVRVSIFDSERPGTESWARERRNTRCSARGRIRTTPRKATPITCARWRKPCGAAARRRRRGRAAIDAIALDTTGSSVIPVDEQLQPLDDYYLWCDHRAWKEAAEITAAARAQGLRGHRLVRRHLFLRVGLRQAAALAAAQSAKSGRASPRRWNIATWWRRCCAASPIRPRRRAASAPWATNGCGTQRSAGCRRKIFWPRVDPLLAGVRAKTGRALPDFRSNRRPPCRRVGREARAAAGHSDSRGRVRCALGRHRRGRAAGRRGQRGGHLHLHHRHQRRSAAGSRRVRRGAGFGGSRAARASKRGFRRPATSSTPSRAAPEPRWRSFRGASNSYRAGETGLLRLTWDNGDRTVLVNPELGGVTLGWRLTHTAQDELFAAIEGTAFHTRVILERMEEHGVPVRRVINGGGIPQKNAVLNQVYANVLGKPVLVPDGDVTSLGSAIFAFLAAGAFRRVEEAQDALCPKYRTAAPEPAAAARYQRVVLALSPALFLAWRERHVARGRAGRRFARAAPHRGRGQRRPGCWKRCGLRSSKPTWSWCGAAWCSTRSAMPAAFRASTGLVVIKPSGVPYER